MKNLQPYDGTMEYWMHLPTIPVRQVRGYKQTALHVVHVSELEQGRGAFVREMRTGRYYAVSSVDFNQVYIREFIERAA